MFAEEILLSSATEAEPDKDLTGLLFRYHQEERRAFRLSRYRRDRADRIVIDQLAKIEQRKDWVVLARGSYARQDFATYSDLDLLFIGLGFRARKRLQGGILGVGNHCPTLQFSSSKPSANRYSQLAFLFTIAECRYVFGSETIRQSFLSNARFQLSTMSSAEVMQLYESDRFCSSLESNRTTSNNLKRGAGGFLDFELLALLILLAQVKKLPISGMMRNHFRDAWTYYRYLSFLKMFLHDAWNGPLESLAPIQDTGATTSPRRQEISGVPWFFKPNIITEVRNAHRHALLRVAFLSR